jgi:hypothetical protein
MVSANTGYEPACICNDECMADDGAKQLGAEIIPAPTTPRTSHISFALCFAALKESISGREDRTFKLEVSAWAYNHVPDNELRWVAWVGCLRKEIVAGSPESLISRVTAALEGRDTMAIEDVRT